MLSNNFAMMVRVRGDISVDQLRAALRQIPIRHPALILARELAPNQFDGEFPLSVRMDGNENDWIEVVQTELSQSFSDEPPFARFTFMKHPDHFDLVGAFHHHVCDGMSGMFVMRDILQVLGAPDILLSPLPLPPSDDMLVPKAISTNPRFQARLEREVAMLRMRVLLEKLRARFLPRKQAAQSLENSPLSNQFVLLPVQLTVSQTTALIMRCKEERVSVHAAVCVAWLRALIGESKGEKRREGMVSSPVNLRRRVSPPIDDTSGGFLTIVDTSVDCIPEKDFWQVAREFKQKFNWDTRDEALFFRTAMFTKAFNEIPRADLDILVAVMFSGPVKYDFSITNLGRIPIPERNGSLQVEGFYGPLVNSSPHERTVGISTLGEQMSISFLFRKSKMNPVMGQELMNCAIRILTEASDGFRRNE